jgi:tRNA uridine 5-carboxymethylaminomethyl modification enzyme
MADDLVTRGVTEPYRMFTSRAEYRLQLREDNADLRLTERGHALGCVPDARFDAMRRKRDAIEREDARLRTLWATPSNTLGRTVEAALGFTLTRETNARDLLRRPGVGYGELAALDGIAPGVDDAAVAEQVEVAVKYAGYLERQQEEIARSRRHDDAAIPPAFDFDAVRGLSAEVLGKLKHVRPRTISEARRISGVTPAAVSLLLVHLKRAGQRVA